MKPYIFAAAALIAAGMSPASAQNASAPAFGEVVVSANRGQAPYAEQNRPVVGLRRQADSVVMQVTITSDSRDAEVRRQEIHAILLDAIGRAPASGVELVMGAFEIVPLTKANYQSIPFGYGSRVDTSVATVMIKAKLSGDTNAARAKMLAFVKSVPRSGRGVMESSGGLTLTIINPDQYRDAIVKQVAEDAKRYAAMFGPEYGVNISGIDAQVDWSQVSPTEVFLFLPYHYNIYPK